MLIKYCYLFVIGILIQAQFVVKGMESEKGERSQPEQITIEDYYGEKCAVAAKHEEKPLSKNRNKQLVLRKPVLKLD
jgi:hypothetical protein